MNRRKDRFIYSYDILKELFEDMARKKRRILSTHGKLFIFGCVVLLLLGTLYIFSVTYVRAYSLHLSQQSQIIEIENEKLSARIEELQQQIDDIKKQKQDSAASASGFADNSKNVVIFDSNE